MTEQSALKETVLITMAKIKPDASLAFADWREKMNAIVATFRGFVSFEVIPPTRGINEEWMMIQRFQTTKEVENWRNSSERQALLEEVLPILEKNTKIREVESAASHRRENVTEVFVTKIKPGKHKEYHAWAVKIQQIESSFPGYQGVYIQAPTSKEQDDNWITMLRFDTPENLNNWLESEERKKILEESESIVEKLEVNQVISPFAGWFSNLEKPPSIWKESMVVLLVLFPIIMLEEKYISPMTAHLNSAAAIFIGNIISVALIAWPLMPAAIYCLKWWLNPNPNRKLFIDITGTIFLFALYLIEIRCFWHLF